MAKQSGLGWTTLSVDTSNPTLTDIKNDVTNFDFSTPRAVQDVTGIDKSAIERLLLLADFSITLNGVFNVASSHTVFKDVATTDVVRTTSLGIASQTLSVECLYTDYAVSRAAGGALTWSAPGDLANGTAPAWS
jgi:hypothetical protein